MKIALLFPENSHSIYKLFLQNLNDLGHDTILIDPYFSRKKIQGKLAHEIGKFHPRLKRLEKNYTYKMINADIKNKLEEFKPNIVISYNDSFLLPDTIDYIKNLSRLIVFLADNPFYSFQKEFFLNLILKADTIITADTGCKEQLEMLGINNIIFSIIGIASDVYNKIEVSDQKIEEYGNDIIFVGGQYSDDSWAMKRALLLNEFADMDLKVWGRSTWIPTLKNFPELKNKFILQSKPMTIEELNLRMNCSKIYPVDHHPGILNGIHARVFETIAAGILPVVEYRKDLDLIFNHVRPPTFKSYSEAKKLVEYYLKNNNEREERARELLDYSHKNLNSKIIMKKLFKHLKI